MDVARLAIALVGTGLVSYGAWLIYEPGGFITLGAILLGTALVGAARGNG